MSAIINGGGGGGGGSFSTLTGGTNTGNAFVVGNGSSISTTGTGSILATPTFPVNAQTANYTVTAADFASAKFITFNPGNQVNFTATLPATAPTAGQAVFIQNIGNATRNGLVTIANNGLNIDGVAGSIVIPQSSAVMIVSDGTNYLTNRGQLGMFTASGNGSGDINYTLSGVAGGNNQILTVTNNGGGATISFSNSGNFYRLTNSGNIFLNNIQSIEAALPVGAAGNDIFQGDSVTHTWSHNSNNNGTMSFSGAWVNTNVTPVTVAANVTTDQNLMSVSVPAGTLNRVGRSLRVWCAGVFSTPAAQTEVLTFKVKLGALTLISIPIPSQSFTATNNQFNISSVLSVQTGGATGVFEAHGNLVIDLGVGNLVADSTFADQNTAVSSTIDLTAAQTLQITVSASVASTSNSFTQRQMVSETVG